MLAISKSWFSAKTILLFPFFVLVIAGLSVPSDGGHGIFSIKSLSFLGTVLSVSIYLLLSHKLNISQYKILCFLMSSLCFCLTWGAVSVIYGETPQESAVDQFKIFWLTLSVVAISIYLVTAKALTFSTIFKTIIYTNFCYSLVKVVLVLLHVIGIINIWQILDSLGIRFMSMNVTGIFFRFQLSNDIVSPFLLFFFLQSENYGVSWNKRFRVFYLIIASLSILLSFSRFLYLAAFLGVLLHAFTLRLTTIVRSIPIIISTFTLIICSMGAEAVYTMFEKRFLSSDVAISDNTRTEQITALLEEHEIYPLMGKGLGGYSKNNIRDEQIRHSYEVQWVAFLMQFGWIGLLIILIPLLVIAAKILSFPITRPKIALFIVFLSWLFSGFTNPFLISLASGILYSLFYLIGDNLRRRKVYEKI